MFSCLLYVRPLSYFMSSASGLSSLSQSNVSLPVVQNRLTYREGPSDVGDVDAPAAKHPKLETNLTNNLNIPLASGKTAQLK